MTTVYGYARVSSRDQNLNRQLDALGAYGVEPANIFADRASGKDFDRPRYRELLCALDSAYRSKCVSTLGASAQVDAPFSAV